jgi:GNAT superfamily N-acetyltransferase
MRVEEIDARSASDEVLLALQRIDRACDAELKGGEPGWTDEEAIAFYRFPPATERSFHWLAGDAGFARLNVYGPAAAFMRLMVVPEERRRGIGSALLEAVLARCRELGATALNGEHATEGGAAFAARAGARAGKRIVRSLVDLRAAPLPEPVVPAGWRLETWIGRVPDEHLDALVEVRKAMDDAPADDELEIPAMGAAEIRASEESLRRRNREMRLTAAIRDDGTIGSFTELRVSHGATNAFTDDTGTLAAHRGQGLAKAVKMESLHRLLADHPEVTVVTTSNAEENAAMRHINALAGFRPTVTVTSATLALGEPS